MSDIGFCRYRDVDYGAIVMGGKEGDVGGYDIVKIGMEGIVSQKQRVMKIG